MGIYSLLSLCLLSLVHGQELFQNPDFEEPFGQDDWYCNGCTLVQSTDAYTGQYSGQVTNRNANWGSVSQYVPVEANKNYFFSIMVKMLTELPNQINYEVSGKMHIQFANGDEEWSRAARHDKIRLEYGWEQIAGDFIMDDREVVSARFYVQFEDEEVDYVVDTATLTEILPNPDWREEANQRIEEIRKSDLTIILSMAPEYDPARMELEVEQTSHDFAFGTAVKADLISGSEDSDLQYQDFFYENYNWAVFENDLKWRQMEKERGEINYERVDNALVLLEERGVPVRGHTIHWNKEDSQPDWLLPIEGQEFWDEMDRRIDYVVSYYSGRLEHWDVNNEQLHNAYFEEKTGDVDILEHMFHEAQGYDPDVLLFLNDFGIVNTGQFLSEYVSCALRLQSKGVPVYALGVQSHLKDMPPIEVLLHRMELLSYAGLPIWVTELDVYNADVTLRADGYEDALRVYFADPLVEGALMWGFWDGAINAEDKSLVDGPDFVVNEAGLRYQSLVHDEWVTRFTWLPGQQEDTYDTRAFQGAYELTVLYDGEAIQSQDFYVSKGQGMTVYVNVEL